MMRTISKALFFALLLGGATTLRASAQDKPGDKARAAPEEPPTPVERERGEAVRQRDRAVQEIREVRRREAQTRRETPGGEIEQAVGRLKERLQDLRDKQKKLDEAKAPEREQAEVREQIARTERELNAVRERLAGGRPPRAEFEAQAREIEEAGRRIRHIRVAAENLKAAGMDDVASKLTEQAENMEREVRAVKERLAGQREGRGGADPRDVEIREVRQQNERLQAEIRELRQKLEKR